MSAQMRGALPPRVEESVDDIIRKDRGMLPSYKEKRHGKVSSLLGRKRNSGESGKLSSVSPPAPPPLPTEGDAVSSSQPSSAKRGSLPKDSCEETLYSIVRRPKKKYKEHQSNQACSLSAE